MLCVLYCSVPSTWRAVTGTVRKLSGSRTLLFAMAYGGVSTCGEKQW